MAFQCYLCSELYSNDNKEVIKHLKTVHKIKENVHQLKCTVRNSNCDRIFATFNGLNRHVKNCASNHDASSNSQIDKPVAAKEQKHDNNNSFVFNETSLVLSDANQTAESSFLFDCSANIDVRSSEAECSGFLLNCSGSENANFNGNDRRVAGFSFHQFFNEMLQLNLKDSDLNTIFRLLEKLLENVQSFCLDDLKTHNDNPLEAFETSMTLIRNGLHEFSSSYKRQLVVQQNELYVEPKEIGIGTQWDLKRDKTLKSLLPVHRQSFFFYISPIETIKSLFKT